MDLADTYLRLGGAEEVAASSVERRRVLGAIVEILLEPNIDNHR